MPQAHKTFYAPSTLHAEQAIKQFLQSYEKPTVRKQTAEKQKAGKQQIEMASERPYSSLLSCNGSFDYFCDSFHATGNEGETWSVDVNPDVDLSPSY